MNANSRDSEQSTPLAAVSRNGAQCTPEGRDAVTTESGVAGIEEDVQNEKREEPVTWRSLPHRRQLIILTLARLSEPLVQTSLQVYPTWQQRR